jgi:hypothetical protein
LRHRTRLNSVGLELLIRIKVLIPTAVTAGRHFFCWKEKFSSSFDEKLASNGLLKVITVIK